MIFLMNSELEYVFFSFFEEEMRVFHKGEIRDLCDFSRFSLIKCEVLQDFPLEKTAKIAKNAEKKIAKIVKNAEFPDEEDKGIKGFIAIFLSFRQRKEVKIIEFLHESMNSLVFLKKNMLISDNFFLEDIIPLGGSKLGLLYKKTKENYRYSFIEAQISESSDKSSQISTPIFLKEEKLSLFSSRKRSGILYVISDKNLRVFEAGVQKSMVRFEFSFGAFCEPLDENSHFSGNLRFFEEEAVFLVSDAVSGALFAIKSDRNFGLKNPVFLGNLGIFMNNSLLELKEKRWFAGSLSDDAVIFKLDEGGITILRKFERLAEIRQISCVREQGNKGLLMKSCKNHENSVFFLRKGLGFQESLVLKFEEKSQGKMHVFSRKKLVLMDFHDNSKVFFRIDPKEISASSEESALLSDASFEEVALFSETLPHEIVDIYDICDFLAIVTRSWLFLYKSLDNALVFKEKFVGGEALFSCSNGENRIFLVICDNLKTALLSYDFEAFALDSLPVKLEDRQVSSMCANSRFLAISFWFDPKILVLPAKNDEFVVISSCFHEKSQISITSMVFDEKGSLLLGLNNGKISVFQRNLEKNTFYKEKTFNICDFPLRLRISAENQVFAVSSFTFLLDFDLETASLHKLKINFANIMDFSFFSGEKAIILKRNSLVLGSLEKSENFMKTAIFPQKQSISFALAPDSSSVVIAHEGKPAEITLFSLKTLEIEGFYADFEEFARITAVFYDDANEIVLVSVIFPQKTCDFTSKLTLISLVKEAESLKKAMVFSDEFLADFVIFGIKKLATDKFVIFGENQLKVLFFDKKNAKFSLLSQKTVNLTIFTLVVSQDSSLLILDVFMKISAFFWNFATKKLEFSHQANFVGSLQNAGFYCGKSLFLTNFLDRSLILVRNDGKKLEIENEWKLREILVASDNFEEIQENSQGNFLWEGTVFSTNTGNLQVLLKISEVFYRNLKKIEGLLREKAGKEEVFDYENSRKLRKNVKK